MSIRLVCLVLTVLACETFNVFAKNNETCGIQAPNNQYPWLVGVEYDDDGSTPRVLCTGALISRKHVVSQADCHYVHGEAKAVRLGGRCTSGSTGDDCTNGNIRVPVEKVIPHPEYNQFEQSSEYNIAVIKLRKSVTYTDVIRPICLPSLDITLSATTDRELYVAGLEYDYPDRKLHAGTIYVDQSECQSQSNIGETGIDGKICAKDSLTNLCLRRGALLMNKRSDKYELVGLLEYKSFCAGTKVFTSVFLYFDWIRSISPDMSLVLGGCGRRKVEHVELIVNGLDTKVGDWPWHAALYRRDETDFRYICGGTLISKTIVLTAAHCTTIVGEPVAPKTLRVILGQYYLIGANIRTQEKEVRSVIVHEEFASRNFLANDISLLKLKTEVRYNDYVQPACLWSSEAFKRLPNNRHTGTVVGWGLDENEALSSQLKQVNIPKVSNVICIRKNPFFYSKVLENNKKFCGGWANGTSPCNGDSGGGFLVFVPDRAKDDSSDAVGAWYVWGLVSMSDSVLDFSRCDPYQYVVFTDVEKYIDWIQRYLDK